MDISFSIWLDSPGAALESGPSSIERDSSIYILTQYTQFDFMENSADFFFTMLRCNNGHQIISITFQCLDAVMDIENFTSIHFCIFILHQTDEITYFALE